MRKNIFLYDRLSYEIVNIIQSYVPYYYMVFTNKKNYSLYHNYLKPYINNYNEFIHYIIRKDYSFVFERILHDNIECWLKIIDYQKDIVIYADFIDYLIGYCIENDANKCFKIIVDIKC